MQHFFARLIMFFVGVGVLLYADYVSFGPPGNGAAGFFLLMCGAGLLLLCFLT